MNRKDFALAFLLGLVIFGVYSLKITVPGYMDAEYYYAMGLRIAKDGTLTEPFLWNFLHPLKDLPRQGFTYWMPLPALLSALGLFLTGSSAFAGAQIGMVVIAALVPPLTLGLTFKLTQNRINAWLAAAFSLFPVFYSPLLVTSDSFGALMVLGGAFFLVMQGTDSRGSFFILGLLSGLLHLTRPDGFLWLLIALLAEQLISGKKTSRFALAGAGYLLVMAGWFARNYLVLGEVMPSGSLRTLWLTDYNELFSYRPQALTIQRWLNQGLGQIINTIYGAFSSNLKTALFVQGQVILAPAVGVGFWLSRKKRSVLAGLGLFGMIFVLMTVVFPFAGMRGSFLHSAAALQPLVWALSSIGFTAILEYAAKARRWDLERSRLIFGVTIVFVLAGATAAVYWDRVIGDDFQDPHWSRSYQKAVFINDTLLDLGAAGDSIVLINNPPGFYIASGKAAVGLPNEGLDALIQVGEEFGVDYLVLEENHPASMNAYYENPENLPGLEFLGTQRGVHFYAFP